MALRITIDAFSGRRNPVIELDGKDAEDALARLAPGRKLKKDEIRPLPESTLGYRGLFVEQIGPLAKGLPRAFRVANGDLIGPRLSHRVSDETFEDFFCGSTGPLQKLELGRNVSRILLNEIKRLLDIRIKWPHKPIVWPIKLVCRCAPLYEPDWWNDGGQKQFNNNCYNYATNYRSDTFAQPGLAAGAMYTALSCPAVSTAATKDELITPKPQENKCPKEGHLVALVVAPDFDFHWYRLGRNKKWTHKPGGTPVTNVDNSGATISDPRTADRGPYTDFCRFMVVMHGHIKIQ